MAVRVVPEELDILELDSGQRLYPDSLKRRAKDGSVEEVRVRIRAPASRDKALAKLDALIWARELAGETALSASLPKALTLEQAEAYLGSVYVDELDTKCLVARCTHDWEAPHDQYMLPQYLDKQHDHASIVDLWERINFWHSYQDVRATELDEDKFLGVVTAIATRRNLSPLLVIAGSARDSCIVSMAERLQSFLTPSSS